MGKHHWWFWPALGVGIVFVLGLIYKRRYPLSQNALGGGSHVTTWSDAIRGALYFSGDGGLFGRGSAPAQMGKGVLMTNPDGSQTMGVSMMGKKI